MSDTVKEFEVGATAKMEPSGDLEAPAPVAASVFAPAPAATPAKSRAPRLYALDLLRFIAAASVVGMHWVALGNGVGAYGAQRAEPYGVTYGRQIFPHSITDALTYGGLGVELFFLISGFVICMSSWGRTVGQFGASRISRLFPAYWFAVLATTAVVLLFPRLGVQGNFSLFRTCLANLTMLQHFFGGADADPVYWTLAQELRFYLLFAIVVAFGVTYRRVLYFCWLWLFVAMLTAMSGNGTLDAITQPDYAPYFIGGIAFFLMWKFGPNLLLWGLVGITFLVAQAQLQPQPQVAFGWNAPMWPMVLVITACYGSMALIALHKLDWVRWKGLTVVGALTYPLYLLHQEIGFTAIAYLYPKMSAKIMLPLMFVVLLGICWLVHRFIEKPSQRLIKDGIGKSIEAVRTADASAPGPRRRRSTIPRQETATAVLQPNEPTRFS
ncbi:peptidoglycan/LPS O-acetylase OafA/YrhL [Catenulispora sp. GP43]|uniref:acyltransferase family protein n=1 Tax=Catenulispora sp. GP43 TaxID=3156263 RepID=UPI003517713B